ncbi:MAG: hypothetical protein ABS84_00535 [Rubrivivax sp. SCN 71-131]|jgi:hypothetical protein|nr:MAG: hypothetical protein ABS84_00535 [Rubrivivax sp. SCN 71-131]
MRPTPNPTAALALAAMALMSALMVAPPAAVAGGAAPSMATADATPDADAGLRLTAWSGQGRLGAQARPANRAGLLAAANAQAPGLAPPERDAMTAELLLRGGGRAGPATLQLEALAWRRSDAGGATHSGLRAHTLALSWDADAWQASAGKKVVAWDIGFGFRPNDMVQQEARRTLDEPLPEGRPLLQLEHFDADTAWSAVWVNPQTLRRSLLDGADPADPARLAGGADESALAARVYHHAGAWDWHGFARAGRHTGASLGAAVVWVAGEALSLHASARWLQRHEAWAGPGEGDPLAHANPWQRRLRGATTQALLGLQWTSRARQSLLLEAWHDGRAPSDADWRRWAARNTVLQDSATATPARLRAANLAWQATPWRGASLRRDNLFARAAWQTEAWTLAADVLWHPADRGRALTASLQWQGERWRVNAAWRRHGGPGEALLRQLPARRQAALWATWAF